MNPRRRTKIVVSLGPSTDRAKTMSALIEQGIDVARLNMSHGTRDDHRRRAQLVRDSAAQQGRAVALLVDLLSSAGSVCVCCPSCIISSCARRVGVQALLSDQWEQEMCLLHWFGH